MLPNADDVLVCISCNGNPMAALVVVLHTGVIPAIVRTVVRTFVALCLPSRESGPDIDL